MDNYFQEARTWSEDVYLEALASRNRYRVAFLGAFCLVALCLVIFLVLLPLKNTEVVLVHHTEQGSVWLEQPRTSSISPKRAQIESDIVRYVVARESYSPIDFEHQYTITTLLSSRFVAKQYQSTQRKNGSLNFSNKTQDSVVRKVEVQNILFLNANPTHPLAQINFLVIDYDANTDTQKTHPFVALIAWKYKGVAHDPKLQWLNWDGFEVTHYAAQQRGV